jgi:pimeloyl-ACP methyl ester carboxylesterase
MTRPRLLLIPGYSELEWVIRPQLEEWAEVATFDAPGVGGEPAPDAYDASAVTGRVAAEVDRLGWQSCVVAADEFAIAAGLKYALQHQDAVQGLALGHACLSFSPDAQPAAVNAEVRSAFKQVAELDDRTFMRHLTQITQGFYGEQLADRMLERIPTGVAQAYVRDSMADPGDWIEGALRDLGKPLLLAEHDPCLLFTKEGYEAAASAFPDSMQVSCREKPTVSPSFADALREFCARVGTLVV